MKRKIPFTTVLTVLVLILSGCSTVKKTYRAGKGTVKGALWAVTGAYKFTRGTTKLVYKIGKFSFEVVMASLDWPLMNEDIETIDGLPVKEAIRQGRVKNSPYTVKGKRYHPMTVASTTSKEKFHLRLC